jgi:hypothetical protein
VNANYDFLLDKNFSLIIEKNTEAQNVRIYYGKIVKVDGIFFFQKLINP